MSSNMSSMVTLICTRTDFDPTCDCNKLQQIESDMDDAQKEALVVIGFSAVILVIIGYNYYAREQGREQGRGNSYARQQNTECGLIWYIFFLVFAIVSTVHFSSAYLDMGDIDKDWVENCNGGYNVYTLVVLSLIHI